MDTVFADELLDAWRENPEGKVLVTHQQLSTALAIQKALLNHPTAGKLLTHPSRAVEVSYFGIDEETGLEVRVRPDLEIDMSGHGHELRPAAPAFTRSGFLISNYQFDAAGQLKLGLPPVRCLWHRSFLMKNGSLNLA